MNAKPQWVWLDAIMAGIALVLFQIDLDLPVHPFRDTVLMIGVLIIGFWLVMMWVRTNYHALTYRRGSFHLIERDEMRRVESYLFTEDN